MTISVYGACAVELLFIGLYQACTRSISSPYFIIKYQQINESDWLDRLMAGWNTSVQPPQLLWPSSSTSLAWALLEVGVYIYPQSVFAQRCCMRRALLCAGWVRSCDRWWAAGAVLAEGQKEFEYSEFLVAFLCSIAEESNPKDGVATIGDVLKVFGTGWLTGPKGIRISDHKSICQWSRTFEEKSNFTYY